MQGVPETVSLSLRGTEAPKRPNIFAKQMNDKS